jgi:GrpB-like predicted nucleotidyltransferase (UPF0157 family)
LTECSVIPKLNLIGAIYTGNPGNSIPFLIEMFGRFAEVEHSVPARQIQYASDDGGYLLFMGVEVECIEDVPEGMVGWEIVGDSWRVVQRNEVVWQETVSWKWLDISNPARPVGEFGVKCPAAWNGSGLPEYREFRITSHSYIGAPSIDDVYLVDYDAAWPEKYEAKKREILELLGPEVALCIEHYGSTSIPGMPAKPIIDILVEIPSWEEGRRCALPAFNTPEVEYWIYGDHMCFIIRDKVTGIRTHHLHMAPAGHRIFEGLAFRDHMKTHPEDAARYLELKHRLAVEFRDDREGYTAAKAEFVREITDRALVGTESGRFGQD